MDPSSTGNTGKHETGPFDNRPIEPEQRKMTPQRIFKWLLLLVFLAYILLNLFRIPLLTRMGQYLIVEHPLKQADLAVCLMGEPVERGLAVADVYRQKLAPNIFVAREPLPDGYDLLRERRIHYPETRDQMIMMLKGLGVPTEAVLTHERVATSTLDEAMIVRDLVLERGYDSLIIVTSPPHTRRAWLTFKRVLGKNDIEIMLKPSPYSHFRSQDWWKTRRYIKEVIVEYQKLLYYALKY